MVYSAALFWNAISAVAWQGEHNVEIRDRRQFGLSIGQPCRPPRTLAIGQWRLRHERQCGQGRSSHSARHGIGPALENPAKGAHWVNQWSLASATQSLLHAQAVATSRAKTAAIPANQKAWESVWACPLCSSGR